jgi:cytochrome P450
MSERPAHPVLLDSMQEFSDRDQSTQAIEIILGGTDTSAFTLAMGIFRILGNPECARKLVACLDKHISKPGVMVPLVELEKINYLVSSTSPAIQKQIRRESMFAKPK